MPDDDQDGPAHRDNGLLLASPARDAPVAFAEEAVGLAGRYGCLAEDPGQVAVAVSGRSVALLAAGRLLDTRGEPGPRAQVSRGGEPCHVDADLGDDHARCDA